MRVRLFLPALFLLSLWLPVPRLRAQGRPLGPWRMTYQMVTERAEWDDWGPAKPGKKVLKLVPTAVRWDIEPDSIRLFLNCENPLIAPAKPRKGQLPIRFTATGATVRLDAKRRRLLIVPSDSVVIMSAYRGQGLVFKHVFRAVAPPLPTVECFYSNTQPTDLKPGEEWEGRLNLRAIPSYYFSFFMPDDARNRVSLSQISFLRNDTLLNPPCIVKGPSVDIGSINNFLPGDSMQVDVQQVQRQNFRGVVEATPYIKHFAVALR
ncbi:hypothetical protein [Hymenobacter rubidus]|uniref:hypothetical protein n=1 Tax=Hymenobacter rubidus TaxID=1441626 RepID=UPI00191D689C|nr:hypothetical protein [Hymenobacter rubidus]